MTADNDASVFFEKHSVSEIEELLAKTRTDIETKKEELRIMVGERYRDLIEAADTISDMQRSTEAICVNIHTMEGLCESLQQRGLIGFKTRLTHGDSDPARLVGTEHLYSFATQIKLLVDVPEILWGLTEKGDFLFATQLLLLAQHTHTAIQLSPNSNEILPHFPVVSCQWSTIMQFKSTIVKGCIHLIRNEIANYESVLDALVAVILIEGIGMEEALHKALSLRGSTLENVLLSRPSSLAKDQLIEFVMLFLASFDMINKIFIVPEGGGTSCLLEQKIRSITRLDQSTDQSTSSPIHFLQESSLALEFLPKSIVEFRPKLRGNLQSLEKISVQRKLSTWLESLIEKSKSAIDELLNCTTNVKALSMIRMSILETQKRYDRFPWREMQDLLEKEHVDPWKSMIRPKVLERAEYLVKKELEDIRHCLVKMVKELAEEIVKSIKVCSEEGDITSFVWGESSSDLPEQIGWISASLRQSASLSVATGGGRGLFFKTRGYTKRIQNITKHLNSQLECLLEDVMQYSSESLAITESLQVESSEEEVNEMPDHQALASEDYAKLLNCVEQETSRCFKSCVLQLEEVAMGYSQMKEEPIGANLWEENKASKPTQEATILIVVSRLCNAFSVVCNQLRISSVASHLAHPDSARRLNLGVQIDSPSWSDLRNAMLDSSNRLMMHFLSQLCQRLQSNLRRDMCPMLQSGTVEDSLLLFPAWENICIEEEDEGGNAVKSNICIPPHPSPILTQVLMKLCSSINYVSVHTVSRSSQTVLNRHLCSSLASVYENLKDHFDTLNQTTALQLIFDIQFIQVSYVPRESKEITLRLSEVLQKLESRVDPFDLDVFLPHMNSRVKTSAQRLQVLLGILIPKDKQLLTKASSVSGGNSILLVVPSVEIPRFSNVPLPVTALSSFSLDSKFAMDDQSLLHSLPITNVRGVGALSRSHDSSNSSTSSLSMTASRSAASLFSAMSSSWFGGGTSS